MLTYQKYNAIRILIESGEEIETIAQTFGCKEETVKLVKRCETYEKYKQEFNTVKFIGKMNRAKTGQHPMNIQQVKIEATHYMMEELKRNNELLTLISNKLTAIMDALGVMGNAGV